MSRFQQAHTRYRTEPIGDETKSREVQIRLAVSCGRGACQRLGEAQCLALPAIHPAIALPCTGRLSFNWPFRNRYYWCRALVGQFGQSRHARRSKDCPWTFKDRRTVLCRIAKQIYHRRANRLKTAACQFGQCASNNLLGRRLVPDYTWPLQHIRPEINASLANLLGCFFKARTGAQRTKRKRPCLLLANSRSGSAATRHSAATDP